MNPKPRVLVGDDRAGIEGSIAQEAFLMKYGAMADYRFTADPDEFIEEAETRQYDVFMIDLKWCDEDAEREYKTGYKILDTVKDYAPVRVLWTSESEEARIKGFEHGATHCIGKSPNPVELEKILNSYKK